MKSKQPTPSNVFLNGVRVLFSDHVKYLGLYLNASLKDDAYIQRSEITVLCSKQAQRHLCSVLFCSEKRLIRCLLHAYLRLPIVEQIHTD